MAGSTSGGDDDMITGINVTPLVDIVLVLLIIFMVTATSIVKAQIGVDLPKAATGKAEIKTTLTFKVTQEGDYILDGDPATEEQIAAKIKKEKQIDPDIRAVVAADKGVNYGRVVELLDLIKLNGVTKFALNIERKARPTSGTK